MLLIPCPWCGDRDETEFLAGGEAGRQRPHDPSIVDESRWADFLFMRQNIKGAQDERWYHRSGCRRWFVVSRDTMTNALRAPGHRVTHSGEGSPE